MTADRKFAIQRREKFVLALLDALTNPEWGISNVDRDHFRKVGFYFSDMRFGLADRLDGAFEDKPELRDELRIALALELIERLAQ